MCSIIPHLHKSFNIATFFSTWSFIYCKTSPNYCLHFLLLAFLHLHLQITIQFAPIWPTVLLCQNYFLIFVILNPMGGFLVLSCLLVISNMFDPLSPSQNPFFLSFVTSILSWIFFYITGFCFSCNVAGSSS